MTRAVALASSSSLSYSPRNCNTTHNPPVTHTASTPASAYPLPALSHPLLLAVERVDPPLELLVLAAGEGLLLLQALDGQLLLLPQLLGLLQPLEQRLLLALAHTKLLLQLQRTQEAEDKRPTKPPSATADPRLSRSGVTTTSVS